MSLLFISKTLGLCNRLRGLLNAWSFANTKSMKFYVSWSPNNECPYHFTELFELLPNMILVDNHNEEINKYEIVTDEAGCLEEFSNLTRRKKGINEIIILFSILKPVDNIKNKIREICKKNDILNCAGIQVRRTDHVIYAEENNVSTPISQFEQVIEHHENSKFKIYLACDCKETQDYFINKYGEQIIYYRRIDDSKELRKTDGEHAVVDLYLLSLCRLFFGTFGSSFSKHVLYLQNMWKIQKDLCKEYIE